MTPGKNKEPEATQELPDGETDMKEPVGGGER